MVKINWGFYTQLKSTVSSFIPPKETHRAELLIALNATCCTRNELRPDARVRKGQILTSTWCNFHSSADHYVLWSRLPSFMHNLFSWNIPFHSRKTCFPQKNPINNDHTNTVTVWINSVLPHSHTPRELSFLMGSKKSQTGETPDGTDGDTRTFDVTTAISCEQLFDLSFPS